MAGKNKTVRNIVIGAVALVVLAGIYFLVTKWEPQQEVQEEPQATPQKIQLFQAAAANVTQVEVDNMQGAHLRYYKRIEDKTSTDADGNETVEQDDVWYIEGYEGANLTSTKIENSVSDFANMAAELEITSDMSKKAEYGLDQPSAKAVMTLQDGTIYTVLLGSQVPTSNNYYAMVEGTDTIYTISQYKAALMTNEPLSFKDTMIGSIAVDDFQNFSLTENGEKKMDVRRLQDSDNLLNANMTDYVMTYPYYEAVRAEEFQEILEGIASVSATEYVAYAPGDLAAYGLEQPRYMVSLADSQNSYQIKIGANVPKEEEDTLQYVYAMEEGDSCVFTMSSSIVDSLKKVDAFSLMEKFLHLVNVSNVQQVVVEGEGKTYTLDVEHYMDQNDLGEDFEEQRYKINGKDANQDRSKKVYQGIIGLRASTNATKTIGEVRYTITFHMLDGTQSVIQYADYDERNYAAIKDGTPTGFAVLKQGVTDMMNLLSDLDSDPTRED